MQATLEKLREEAHEKQRVINDMSRQLEESTKRTQLTQTQLSDKMGNELSEVRDALREYQLEMESEKRKFHHELEIMQEQLNEKEAVNNQLAEEAIQR